MSPPSTVGSASQCTEHREAAAFASPGAFPSECIVPRCGLLLSLQPQPPLLPPQVLPTIRPCPRRLPPSSKGPPANPAGLEEGGPAAAHTGVPKSPSGSTTFFPSLSPQWLPSLVPLLGVLRRERGYPRFSGQEFSLAILTEPLWRIPKSDPLWKPLQLHSHHPFGEALTSPGPGPPQVSSLRALKTLVLCCCCNHRLITGQTPLSWSLRLLLQVWPCS